MVENPVRHDRAVVRVPVLLIPLLEAAGKLPVLSNELQALMACPTRRDPTLAEGAALSWLLIWDGPQIAGSTLGKAAGVAAYRDVYDYHTGSDVREVIHVAGSKRAVHDLMLWMAKDAKENGRRIVGSIDPRNIAMHKLLDSLGGKITRVVMEDVT